MPRALLISGLLLLATACGACADAHEVMVAQVDGGDPAPAARIDEHGCRPDADYVVGGGRRLAACEGECRFDLSLSSVIELLSSECASFRATLRVSDALGRPLYAVSADLNEPAWDRVARLGSALRTQRLAASYGCPECAGRVAAWLQTQPPAAEPRQSSYELAAPPALLVEADAFVQGLIEQLRSCVGPDLALCSREP